VLRGRREGGSRRRGGECVTRPRRSSVASPITGSSARGCYNFVARTRVTKLFHRRPPRVAYLGAMRQNPRLHLLLLLCTSLSPLLAGSCGSSPSTGAGGASSSSSAESSSSSSSSAESSSSSSSAQSSSSSSSGAGGGAPLPQVQVIDITIDPNGLYWDTAES